MAENDLKVLIKAKELAVHSFKLTSNCNRYPKKYRHSLVDRIQIKSLDIYDTLLEANRTNNITRKHERWFQTDGSAERSLKNHMGRGKTTYPTETASDWGERWIRQSAAYWKRRRAHEEDG